MELVKHNQHLAARIKFLDTKADSQIAKELMELHQVKCKACQKDRLSCTVRPSCKNRNFLNFLIELGINPQDLPAFCYGQYMDQLRRYIIDKKGRGMINRRLLIKDLLSTLQVSSIRHFNIKFKKLWMTHSRVRQKDLMLVAGDDLIFQFDFSRGIVLVNPINIQIDSYEILSLYIQLLGEYHGIATSVRDIALNWWEFSIEVGSDVSVNDFSSIKSKLSNYFESFKLERSDDNNLLRIEITVDGVKPLVEVGHIVEIFNLVASLGDTKTKE